MEYFTQLFLVINVWEPPNELELPVLQNEVSSLFLQTIPDKEKLSLVQESKSLTLTLLSEVRLTLI